MRIANRITILVVVLLALGSGPATLAAATLDFEDLISAITPWDGPVNPANGN